MDLMKVHLMSRLIFCIIKTEQTVLKIAIGPVVIVSLGDHFAMFTGTCFVCTVFTVEARFAISICRD